MDYEERTVTNIYENIAEHFNNTRSYTWNWIENYIKNITNNSLILDLGCGNGRNMLISKNHQFIGIDNCNKFIDICKKKELNIIKSDMCQLPFKDNSFDNCISIASFHHLCNNERRTKCLLEIYRILKPDSTLLISVWSKKQPEKTKRKFNNYGDNIVKWNKFGNIYERYYYIFKIDEIKTLFNKCNFKILKYEWSCGNEIFILKK